MLETFSHMWLHMRCKNLQGAPLQESDEPEFQILKFTIKAANDFFRICRSDGVFIPDPDRLEAVAASQYMCEPRLISLGAFYNDQSFLTATCSK